MFFELPAAGGGYSVRLPAITGLDRTYPALVFQAGNRAVKRAGSEPNPGERLDVEDHCITMLFAVRKAGQHEK